jgi:hypothetical protein
MCAFFAWRLLRSLQAKNQAFRFKSSDLLMQILWAFRCNPLRAHSGSAKLLRNFATNPLRPTGFPGFGTGSDIKRI